MEIRAVKDIDGFWPLIEPIAEKMSTISNGVRTPEGIRRDAKEGNFSLWAVMDDEAPLAVIATIEGVDDSNRPFGMIVDAVGEQKERWVGLVRDQFRDYFKERGNHRYLIMGRKGWARDLPTMKMKTCIFEEVIQ